MFFCLTYSSRIVANFIPSGLIAIQAIVPFCQSVKKFIFHVAFKKHAMQKCYKVISVFKKAESNPATGVKYKAD